MIDLVAGTSHTLRVDFHSATGPLPADDGSISYRVLTSAGAVIRTSTPIAFPNGGQPTGINVALTSISNPLLTGTKVFEQRVVEVTISSGGETHVYRKPFRAVTQPIYSTSPDDVRAFLGLDQDDLPDDDLDLYATYLKVQSAPLDAALVAGDKTEIDANRVILFTEVLRVIPSLRMRLIVSSTDGALTVSRLKSVDFDALTREAREALNEALDGVRVVTPILPGLSISLSNPTDRITGA